MNWELCLSTFVIIFLAELPDKTAFATILLATKGRPFPIFLGVAIAFLVQTVIGVAMGRVISFLPTVWVHYASALLFFVFAVLAWRGGHEDEEAAAPQTARSFWKSAWMAFVVIFIAEWGDLTQLATATLVAERAEWLSIAIGAVLALWSVTAIAVLLGSAIQKICSPKTLQRVSAIAFVGVGIFILVKG
jgi:putative Ca2+/H+ antiporter (TMEM165/GDT1 family)